MTLPLGWASSEANTTMIASNSAICADKNFSTDLLTLFDSCKQKVSTRDLIANTFSQLLSS